jgi:hypothetical protein
MLFQNEVLSWVGTSLKFPKTWKFKLANRMRRWNCDCDLSVAKLPRALSRFVLELGDTISGISRVPSQAARSIG